MFVLGGSVWTSGRAGHFHTHVDRQGPLLTHMMWGTSPLVARSLSVSANVCRGAEALFPGQGKQIVGLFANEKKWRSEEKESRKWGKVLSWTGDQDYIPMTLSSTQRKWRDQLERRKWTSARGKNSLLGDESATRQTADALQDVATGCWLGTSAEIYWKVIQQQEEDEKKRGKARERQGQWKVKRKKRVWISGWKRRKEVEHGGEVREKEPERERGRGRDTSPSSRHPRCCLFCVKVNDKRGMKSAEKGKTTARVQSPPSQLIQLHRGSLHNGPLLLTTPPPPQLCVCDR